MDSMYGWRARIGCIHPSANSGWYEKFRKVTPEGVELVEARLFFPSGLEPGTRDTEEAFPFMLEQIEKAAKEVASAAVQCIIQMGGALSMFRGWGADREIITRIEKATGIAATTHGIAETEALHKLDMHKVVVFTPYQESVNVAVQQYICGSGVEVVLLKRLGGVREVAEASPYGIYRAIKDTFLQAPPADGMIILCGALSTFEIIQALEYDTGKPVVTADQAALWKVLNMVSVREPIKGYGRLLERL